MKYLRDSIILRFFCAMMAFSLSIPLNAAADSFPGCLISNPCDCECGDYSEMWPSTAKTLHGKTIQPVENTGTSNCVCPPYNKNDGRTNCLKNPNGVGYPGMFDVTYMNICAEESPNSNYFAPAIRYRNQTCNIACWTLKGDLTGDGQCTVIPTAYGVPTIRLCARMAKPSVPASGTPGDIDYVAATPADPGYTPDVHLDFEGYIVDDNPLSNGGYDINGNPISTPDPNLQAPKICLYWDPDLLDTLLTYAMMPIIADTMLPILGAFMEDASGMNIDPASAIQAMFDIDFMDYNPIKQANHKTNQLNPIFQFLVDMSNAQVSLENMVAQLIDSLPDYIKYSMMPLSVLEYTLELGAWIIQHGMIPILEFIGAMNRVVVGSFGCVNVPLGPFPPPYCQPLAQTLSVPTTYEICPTAVLNNGTTTIIQQSTTTDPCSASGSLCNASCWDNCAANNTCNTCTPPIPYGLCVTPLSAASRNNVVNNSIRVGFTEYKPLCTTSTLGATPDTSDGTCVAINGPLNAATYGVIGSLPLCLSSAAATNVGSPACIISEFLSNKCNTDSPMPWYCSPGARIRVAFGIAGGGNGATDYYDTLMPDCASGNQSLCQSVYGINLGAYADLVVKFPEVEPSNDATYDVQPDSTLNSTSPIPPSYRVSDQVSLLDAGGSSHTFQAIVTRADTQISPNGITPQEPQQICAYEIISSSAGGTNYVAVGCNDRAVFPKPQLFDCSTDSSLCTSSFMNPAMIVALNVPLVSGAVCDPTNPNSCDSTQGSVGITTSVNLAGSVYSSYATDSTFAKQPFSGSHVILNPQSIFGNYLYDAVPYDNAGNINAAAVYLNGIEYLNGNYQVGAQQICLTGYAFDDCFSGNTRQNCVLAELLNSSVISCTTFNEITKTYPGIALCNPNNTKANNTSTICDFNNPGDNYNGNNGNIVNIINCATTLNMQGVTSVVNSNCYNYTGPNQSVQNNQPLCQVSYDGTGRLVPPTNTDSVLPNGYYPNIDYYNYTPGISASATQSVPDVATNSKGYKAVISSAQSTYSAPITTTYAPSICTSNAALLQIDPTIYTNMISACTTARNAASQITSICSATQNLLSNINLTNACNDAQTSITSILTDQSTTDLIAQMQADATSAQAVVTTLMNAITSIGNPNALSKAQSIQSAPITTTYSPSICTSLSTPYNNMMQACITARSTSDKINSICTNTQNMIADATSTLYQQLQSACNTAKSSVQTILLHQFNMQTITDMQTDASSAQAILTNLMNVINSFSSNPTVIQNIISTEQGIYNSTNTTTYPVVNGDNGATAKIAAICTQTEALVTSASYPTLFSTLTSACVAAQGNGVVPATALATLNAAITGFTKYDVSDNGATLVSNTLVTGNVVTTGYTPPDFTSMVVRNRTDVENGLCVAIPQPQCAATTVAQGPNNGYATWANVDIGIQSTGTCLPGYSPISPTSLSRYCTFNKTNNSAGLTAIDQTMGCKSVQTLANISSNYTSNLRAYDPSDPPFLSPTQNSAATADNGTIEYSTGSLYCDNNPCTGTVNLTFNVGDVANIKSFILSYIDIKDWVNIYVNNTLVYSADGYSLMKYDIRTPNIPPSSYPSSQGGLPQNLGNGGPCENLGPYPTILCDTTEWGQLNPNLDIAPYLQTGANKIVFTFYSFEQGKLRYTFNYVLTQP